MENRIPPKKVVHIFVGKIEETSNSIFYFEKKEQNPLRKSFRELKIKIHLPNDKSCSKKAFLKEDWYSLDHGFYKKGCIVHIEKHFKGVYKGFWIVLNAKETELKRRKVLDNLKQKNDNLIEENIPNSTLAKNINTGENNSPERTVESENRWITLLLIGCIIVFISFIIGAFFNGINNMETSWYMNIPLTIGGFLVIIYLANYFSNKS